MALSRVCSERDAFDGTTNKFLLFANSFFGFYWRIDILRELFPACIDQTCLDYANSYLM